MEEAKEELKLKYRGAKDEATKLAAMREHMKKLTNKVGGANLTPLVGANSEGGCAPRPD